MEQPTLGQLIWPVRRELEWARAVDTQHPLRFDIEKVELDVTVEVAQTRSGGAGLDLKVMGVGLSGKLGGESSGTAGSQVHVVLAPSDTRAPDGKLQVSALDTEPPPRHPPTSAEVDGLAADDHEHDATG